MCRFGFGQPGYPSRLRRVPGRPEVWARGTVVQTLDQIRTVAVIGPRRAHPGMLEQARSVTTALVRAETVVVSGLAAGVDEAVHRTALAAGGQTVAVLGTGVDVPPKPVLAEQIAASGALLSRFPPGTGAAPGCWLRRNMILAAFAEVVVVIDGRDQSGTSSTVNRALTLGTPVVFGRWLLTHTWADRAAALGAVICPTVDAVVEAAVARTRR